MREQRARSLVKAITYRMVSSVLTGSPFFAVTRRGSLSIGVALFDAMVKTSVFYLHERAWSMIGAYRGRHLQIEEAREAA